MKGMRIAVLASLSMVSLLEVTACSAQPGPRTMDDVRPPRAFVATPQWRFGAGTTLPILARGGMVTSTDRVATEIGVEMLRRGGNAVDAAIAVHFALAVVNPEAGNLGGGGFMVIRTAAGEAAALDFRERAPLRSTRDMFLDAGGQPTNRSTMGLLASAVPGSVAGMWAAHQRYGSLPWADLVQPAINLAEGMVVHERLAESLGSYESRLRLDPASAAIFLASGAAPRVGDRLVQRDLAETLRRIAREGHDGFYRGATARLLAEAMRRGGGLIDERDLESYSAVWREPVTFTYRGHTILSMPPPSSGGVTLAQILNILEGYDLPALGHLSAAHVHLLAEASKRAFVDRNAYLADPDFVPQPLPRMASADYAAERRAGIDPARATPAGEVQPGLGGIAPAPLLREGDNTTHVSIVDGNGGAVALTTTLNSLYGNGITVPGSGFLLNNVMDDFTIQPGIPNQFGLVQGEANTIEPGKRMLSAMTPTIVLDPSGAVRLVTGSPGGPTIITTVAQVVSNILDFGMNSADASAAPRIHHQHLPDVLRFEQAGLDPATVQALRAMGHTVEERTGYSGDTQTISVLPDGSLAGAADPRRGGAVAGVNEVFQVLQ